MQNVIANPSRFYPQCSDLHSVLCGVFSPDAVVHSVIDYLRPADPEGRECLHWKKEDRKDEPFGPSATCSLAVSPITGHVILKTISEIKIFNGVTFDDEALTKCIPIGTPHLCVSNAGEIYVLHSRGDLTIFNEDGEKLRQCEINPNRIVNTAVDSKHYFTIDYNFIVRGYALANLKQPQGSLHAEDLLLEFDLEVFGLYPFPFCVHETNSLIFAVIEGGIRVIDKQGRKFKFPSRHKEGAVALAVGQDILFALVEDFVYEYDAHLGHSDPLVWEHGIPRARHMCVGGREGKKRLYIGNEQGEIKIFY